MSWLFFGLLGVPGIRQGLFAKGLDFVQSGEHFVDIATLLQEARPAGLHGVDEGVQLLAVVVLGVLHVDKFHTLVERHTNSLAAQYEFYAYAVRWPVDAFLTLAQGRNQAFLFIEADCPGCYPKLFGQL